ncbi:hypothetical protein [Vibrio mangrovi]|uniref:Uncharacterized protein n=1 Tax=Vibrio mangrovi TaxID=474394 RepID=A0A1Y6IX44_9VIBR|nr:hypothetical protein [Vibrio mangrovi]MDW6002753.1 hypothetical protein [Vibrio mangrovi]SMS02245.1 hypothetical protein VIM7927_03564 [Vibrio mangrovi]
MRLFLLLFLALSSFSSFARLDTTCHTWPMNMAKIWLQDKKIVNEDELNEDRTQFKLLASETMKNAQYTDVYLFSFFDKTGKEYDVITQNISSDEECSISDVNIYMVSGFKMSY